MDLDPKTFWTLVLVLAAAMAYRYMPRWRARSPFIGAEVLKGRMDAGEDVVVIDVRTPREYDKGHVPGAVNVPLSELAARMNALGGDLAPVRDQPVYVHCASELRAAKGARALRDTGFTDVSVVTGGFNAWRRKGFPIQAD